MPVLIAPMFMTLVAQSVINVTLVSIGNSVGATSSDLQWVISGYILTFAMLLVPAGRLGDATGRRRMFIIGTAVFTVGSLFSGIAPNVSTLELGRVLQGAGAGLLGPQVTGLITRHFTGAARAKAFAAVATSVSTGAALGPVLGGVFIQLLGPDTGWRWMFLMNIPIGLLAVVMAFFWVPDDKLRGSARHLDLDPMGLILLTIGVLGLMLPFLERGAGLLVWLTVPVGLMLVGLWWLWEHRYTDCGHTPMVRPDLFENKAYRNGAMIIAIYFMGITSMWIITPMFALLGLGRSAFEASLLGAPSALLAGLSAQVAGRHVLRLGRRMVIAANIVAVLAFSSSAVMAWMISQGWVNFWLLLLPLSLIGLSQGFAVSPNQTLTLNAVDPAYGGVAGGVYQLGQRLGTAIGTAVIPGTAFALTERGAPWIEAYIITLASIITTTIVALGLSVHDLRRERRLRAAAG